VRSERDAAVREQATKRAKDASVVLDDAAETQVLAFVDGLRKPVGKRLVAAGLRGGRSKRAVKLKLPDNPAFGALRGTPEVAILQALDALLSDGRLVAKGKKYPTVWIPEKRVRPTRDPSRPKPEGATGLRGALKNLRTREARRRRWKPYQVFPDKTLDAIVATRPTTVAELLEIPGLGPARIEKFSDGILETIRRFP
jgi:ATP-dependent DNA helicase RecQ